MTHLIFGALISSVSESEDSRLGVLEADTMTLANLFVSPSIKSGSEIMAFNLLRSVALSCKIVINNSKFSPPSSPLSKETPKICGNPRYTAVLEASCPQGRFFEEKNVFK